MADLTIGDVGVTLQEQLLAQDLTQDPPVQVPLDLTQATLVQLSFLIINPNYAPPQPPVKTVDMGVVGLPTNGTVFYDFQAGDLAKPGTMGKYGVFRYSIKVTFQNGDVFTTNEDGELTIKDDSVL